MDCFCTTQNVYTYIVADFAIIYKKIFNKLCLFKYLINHKYTVRNLDNLPQIHKYMLFKSLNKVYYVLSVYKISPGIFFPLRNPSIVILNMWKGFLKYTKFNIHMNGRD